MDIKKVATLHEKHLNHIKLLSFGDNRMLPISNGPYDVSHHIQMMISESLKRHHRICLYLNYKLNEALKKLRLFMK